MLIPQVSWEDANMQFGLLLWCKNEKNVRYLEAMWEFYVSLSANISVRFPFVWRT